MWHQSSWVRDGCTSSHQCKIHLLATYCNDLSCTLQHDDQLVKDYGVRLAADMIQRLTTEGGVPGVHLCTLNLEKSVSRVLELLRWTGVTAAAHNKLIAVCPTLSTFILDNIWSLGNTWCSVHRQGHVGFNGDTIHCHDSCDAWSRKSTNHRNRSRTRRAEQRHHLG